MVVITRNDNLEDQEEFTPKRDARGRYRPGSTGNPRGRPKQPKLNPPHDFSTLLFELCNREIAVNDNGKRAKVRVYELLMRRIIQDIVNGDAIDRVRILKMLETSGASAAIYRAQEITAAALKEDEPKLPEAFLRALEDVRESERPEALEKQRKYEAWCRRQYFEAKKKSQEEGDGSFGSDWGPEGDESDYRDNWPNDETGLFG